jgi:hypothetical protein
VLGAQLAHGEEATLAGLALFVWHFYNVHLRPSIFPMSWTWLDGKIGIEQLREEHGEVYDQLLANGGRDPTSESSSAIGPAVQPTRGGPEEKEGPE